jgi:glutaminyl-peptide cyclotransferase
LRWSAQCSPAEPSAKACRDPAKLRFNIAGKITRSETGFTQGLEVHDGALYESTGRIGGTTRLNVISFDGTVKRLADLGTSVFGEGLTILKDEMFQLTWQDHQVFVHDLAGQLKREMGNPRDGWGLTNDGTNLILAMADRRSSTRTRAPLGFTSRSGSGPLCRASSRA